MGKLSKHIRDTTAFALVSLAPGHAAGQAVKPSAQDTNNAIVAKNTAGASDDKIPNAPEPQVPVQPVPAEGLADRLAHAANNISRVERKIHIEPNANPYQVSLIAPFKRDPNFNPGSSSLDRAGLTHAEDGVHTSWGGDLFARRGTRVGTLNPEGTNSYGIEFEKTIHAQKGPVSAKVQGTATVGNQRFHVYQTDAEIAQQLLQQDVPQQDWATAAAALNAQLPHTTELNVKGGVSGVIEVDPPHTYLSSGPFKAGVVGIEALGDLNYGSLDHENQAGAAVTVGKFGNSIAANFVDIVAGNAVGYNNPHVKKGLQGSVAVDVNQLLKDARNVENSFRKRHAQKKEADANQENGRSGKN